MQSTRKRIVRDVLMLGGFLSAFVIFLALFGGLESNDSPDEIHFSQDRVRANRSQNRKDWETAQLNLLRILERDPHDGRAQFELGTTLYRQRNVLVGDLNELTEAGKQDSEDGKRIEATVKEFNQKTVDELVKAKRFARYRGRSLLILSVIEAERGDWDETLKYLDEFVETGNFTFDGLARATLFGEGGEAMAGLGAKITQRTKLHAMPKFWDICRREQANRAQQ